MSTTAKIAAAATKDTGITPELATTMWNRLGSRHIAIVELAVDSRSEDTEDFQSRQARRHLRRTSHRRRLR